MAEVSEDLELLYHSEKTNFLSRNDVLVVAVHSFLLEEGLRCVGKGEEFAKDEVVGKGSKRLPLFWNEDQEKISLKYVLDEMQFVMSVFADGDNTMLTLKDQAGGVEAICVDVDAYIGRDYDSFESAYCNLEALYKTVKSEVIAPVVGAAKKRANPEPSYFDMFRRHSEQQKKKKKPIEYIDDDDADVDPLMVPGSRRLPNPLMQQPGPSAYDYGRSDLDPFSGIGGPLMGPGGGGMLFSMPRLNRQPQIPGMLPRGSVPPGARFDPFGPSTGRRMPRPMYPDPDVGLPPPGSDDMFM